MDMKKISQLMDNAINSGEEVGAAVVIVKDGAQVGSYACGYADAESKKPMQTDTICRMFSCSKIATAVAAMICLERGLIAMEARLSGPFFRVALMLLGVSAALSSDSRCCTEVNSSSRIMGA